MGNIAYYWNNKGERAKTAAAHTAMMEKRFHNEILESVKRTRIYDGYVGAQYERQFTVDFNLEDTDSVSAILNSKTAGKTAVLNFASYKNPGGGFLAGSRAQEESLCHESFLYNVLCQFPKYYNHNQQYLNYGLYNNRALYTPDVIFTRGTQQAKCDVITCAAPNATTFFKYNADQGEDMNQHVLESRIAFVLDIAADNCVDHLILGAYGCGVFGQDPENVAQIFKDMLTNEYRFFPTITFAVPRDAGHPQNYMAFEKIL